MSSCRRISAETYRDEDQLGLAAAESLQGAAVAQHNLARLDDEGKLFTVSVKHDQRLLQIETDLGANGLGVGLGLLGGHCDGSVVSEEEKS